MATENKGQRASTNTPGMRETPESQRNKPLTEGAVRTPGRTDGEILVDDERSDNPDAITSAPGSHPIGTGIGAVSAGAAGAMIGTAIGPVGTVAGGVIGAVVGAVAGGLAGKGVAEAVNPTDEDAYWRENYIHRPYYIVGASWDEYAGDYRYGYEAAGRYDSAPFETAEPHLRRDWEARKENAGRVWDKSKHAVKDSYHRVVDKISAAMPGQHRKNSK